MQVKIYENEATLFEAYADYIIQCANAAIEQKGNFNLVLSGGNSPKRVFELLSSEAYKYAIDWENTYVFFTDERFVPYDDTRNNGTMVLLYLFGKGQLPLHHFFRIQTNKTPKKNAQGYMRALEKHFDPNPIHFDLVLLGLGDNVHTASLFPNQSVLHDDQKDVKSFFLEEENIYRITMNAPLLNDSDHIGFLVFGENKSLAVKHALESDQNVELYPAQLIDRDKSVWFMDNKAAALLSNYFS